MTTPPPPAPTPVLLTANQLRALAEQADGNRGKNLKLIASVDGKHPATFVLDTDPGDPITICVNTKDVKPKTGNLEVVLPNVVFNSSAGTTVKPSMSYATGKEDNYFNAFDALFWSAAAVDKFAVRYYASFVELEDIRTRIRDAFAQEDVLAIGHLPESEPADASAGTATPLSLMKLTWKAASKQIEASPLI